MTLLELVSLLVFKTAKKVLPRSRILGLDNIEDINPSIFIANHIGSFGPIAVIRSFPLKL